MKPSSFALWRTALATVWLAAVLGTACRAVAQSDAAWTDRARWQQQQAVWAGRLAAQSLLFVAAFVLVFALLSGHGEVSWALAAIAAGFAVPAWLARQRPRQRAAVVGHAA